MTQIPLRSAALAYLRSQSSSNRKTLHYDLDGNFIEEAATRLNMPTSVAIQGEYVSVPSLDGRLYILDKNNSVVSVLGYKSDPGESLYRVHQEDWVEGVFRNARILLG